MSSRSAEILVMAWGWLQIAIGVVCLYLVYLGLRVPKLDTHPHCRKCLYDLSGRPRESTQCPECGLDITRFGNIVRGYTRRQWRFVVWAVLLAGTTVAADQVGWSWARETARRPGELRQALAARDDVAVKKLLALDPSLLDRPETVSYYLEMAIRSKGDLVVAALLKDPRVRSRLGVVDTYGNTPLGQAIERGSPGIVAMLVGAGADPMQKDAQGRLPMDVAVMRPTAWLLQALIDGGVDVQATDEWGRTVLHRCASLASMGMTSRPKIEAVLRTGRINVDVRDREGNTPLAIAIRSDVDAAWCLLQHGADLLARNDKGVSVSRAAVDAGRGEAVAHIWAKALLDAVASGRGEHARRLIRAEPWLLEAPVGYGQPYPMHLVRRMPNVTPEVARARFEVLKILLEEGMSVQTADGRGTTLLHVAAESGDGEMFRFLLERGADEKAKDRRGRTPMEYWPTQEGQGIVRIVRGQPAATQRAQASPR